MESFQEHYDSMMRTIAQHCPQADRAAIDRAVEYACVKHADQKRKDGSPYIIHPLAVAEIVAEIGLDTDAILGAILHDCIEDTDSTYDEIARQFASTVAALVEGVTKLTRVEYSTLEQQQMENLRKMFMAMSKDIRVVLIKICDRLHNTRTMEYQTPAKQISKSRETMDIYAPLAHRLGMQKIKWELEDTSLKYLDPDGYNEIMQYLAAHQAEADEFMKAIQTRITTRLSSVGIHGTIYGRIKHVYSIYRKMKAQDKKIDELYDMYAFRVIVDSIPDCYNVLGHIHDLFNLVPGRFKDYISTPKPNMYQSLHTTVIGQQGIPFEVQIRTWEMHRDAEYGLAAHWKYKSGEQASEVVDRKLQWIRTLLETEKDGDDLDEFVRPLKIDLFEDETFVFTPKGDVVSLPNGATPIDFAYAIHSAVGNKMVGAKVNGNIVPIDYKLQTGQIVEVLTSAASKGPSRDWLKIVRSGEARNKIRQYFKREMRQENIQVGKTEIDRELRRFGRNYTEAQKEEIVHNVAARMSLEVEDFYNNIGYGGLSVSKLTSKLRDEFTRVVKPNEAAPKQPEKAVRPDRKAEDRSQSVILDGLEGCDVKFAKCCNPLPGDPIIGFITKGFGVSIHKYDCPNAVAGLRKPEDKDRWIVASWAQKPDRQYYGNFEAVLHIYAKYSPKIIADVTVCLADLKVALNSVTTRENGDSMLLIVGLKCSSIEHLKNIIGSLKKLPDVRDVTRAGR